MKIFLLHGLMSSSKSLEKIAAKLRSDTKLEVELIDYDWSKPVLDSISDIYNKICQRVQGSSVFLVGHSQGGLVCRLLAVLMTNRQLKDDVLHKEMSYRHGNYFDKFTKIKLFEGDQPNLIGVVTLASPNSGALNYGQLSATATFVLGSAKAIASMWPFEIKNLHDMTTDLLPRLLQNFSVPQVRYLSVSGSRMSRYTLAYDDLLSNGISALVFNFSVRLSKPNDLLIEEESADLTRLLLPFEGEEFPRHINGYIDCCDVHHTNIHTNRHVQKAVANWILQLV